VHSRKHLHIPGKHKGSGMEALEEEEEEEEEEEQQQQQQQQQQRRRLCVKK
jgi:hypothetical protein